MGSSAEPESRQPSRRWAWGRAGLSIGFVFAVVGACSQGATSNPFPGLPPQGPQAPDDTRGDDTAATFGVDEAGGCCEVNGTPGCEEVFLEACVCADLPECCSNDWTRDCVEAVEDLGCGVCGSDSSVDDTGPPPMGQECCISGVEPGCNDFEIQSCVCEEIPFCCDTEWQDVCAAAVDALGCGHCGGADTGEEPPPGGSSTGGEPPPPPPPQGGCCEPQQTPGCTDAAVQNCVCAMDDFCCMEMWDQLCVDQVDSLMCGDCGGAPPPPPPPPQTSTCCQEQAMAGCDQPLVEACVCLIDGFCCSDVWDNICVLIADVTCFADC